MNRGYKDQLRRIDRLMTVIESDNLHDRISGLETIDIVIFACQSMWHLKDWILNDPSFCAANNKKELEREIHASRCLLICSDLANGSKHLRLNNRKTDAKLSETPGVQLDSSKGIFREIYYVWCDDYSDEFHGMEIRDLLRNCRDDWQKIIDKNYHSNIDEVWEDFVSDLPMS